MNKLINTWNRGFSLKNDDFRFIDDSVRLALTDIAKSFGPYSTMRLWGAEITVNGTVATITEGAIYYQGEVFHVYPHVVNGSVSMPYSLHWRFVTEWDSAGVKVDADLQSHNAYQIRKALVSETALPNQFGSTPVSNVVNAWEARNGIGIIALVNAQTRTDRNASNMAIKHGNLVTLDMGITVLLSGDGWQHCATIPINYRPKNIVESSVYAYEGIDPSSTYIPVLVRIDTTGEINIKRVVLVSSPRPCIFNINGPSFYID